MLIFYTRRENSHLALARLTLKFFFDLTEIIDRKEFKHDNNEIIGIL